MNSDKILHCCALSLAAFLLVGRWSLSRLDLDYSLFEQLPDLRILALLLPIAFAGYYSIRLKARLCNRFQLILFAFVGWMCISAAWSIQPNDASAKLLDGVLVFLLLGTFSVFAHQFGPKKFIAIFTNYYFILLALRK